MAYRHELKFEITPVRKQILMERLSSVMRPDPNAGQEGYFIRSLYFDDLYDSAFRDKLAGVNRRKKYRIRIYNCSDGLIKLERKKKEGAFIKKEAVSLQREELDRLLKGDAGFLLQREETLAKEFYLETVMNGLAPTVVVDYDRIPLVFPGGDVRITFDEHIRAGRFGGDLFQKELPSYEVLPEGKLILEVKFTEYLPEIIRDLLPAEEAAVIAASKYVLCLRKQREMLFHQGEE